ncbi:MAG: hypothetical protein HY900_14120 [Deltaproteobacteria bacterium]|nr:hypothetical protein [Deltaproteobacteria bacterium]
MKNKWMVVLITCVMALSAVPVLAEDVTIEGTVTGYMCAVLGKACPADKEDPIVAAERAFVVMKSDGEYFLVPNVDRAVMARHLTEKVRIKGTMDGKYKAINAMSLEAMKNDKWTVFWSQAMEDEALKMLSTQH